MMNAPHTTKIALFGGGFDPPHIGHQKITTHMLDHHIVDEVWYVPVKNHPFGKKVLPDADRLAMLDLILDPSQKTRIETYELSRPEMSYTFLTLEHLTQKHPHHQFSWIIGTDNLANFHKWTAIHPMLLKYPFYVYPRAGFPFEPMYEGMISLKDAAEVTVSSTEIRKKIAKGQTIAGLVDPRVEEYIQKHKLYATQ